MSSLATEPAGGGDRRARRRQETIEEILDLAVDVMDESGVNALSIAEIARRLGVQPPSLYKYFDSLLAVYDALFRRGATEHLAAMQAAMAGRRGLPALAAGLEASGRWCLEHRSSAQLLFWRPVPSFEPTPEALEPSITMVQIQRDTLAQAVADGELGPAAASDEAIAVVAIFIAGAITMAMANEPEVPWGEGRFTPVFPQLMTLLPTLYPPGS